MKTYQIVQKVALALLGGVLLFSVSACKKAVNPIENLNLIIDYNIIKTTLDVQLVDATTGRILNSEASQGAYVKYSGPDEDAVVDVLGVRPTDKKFGVSRGLTTLALVPNAPYEPSPEDAVNFNVIAHVQGYLVSSKEVNITQKGRNFVSISLVPLSNPPSGVFVRQEPNAATTQAGRVVAPGSVVVPGGSARVTIPEGMLIRDSGGNPLSGSLDVTLVRFSNTDPQSIAAFPGGLLPTVTRLDGSTTNGMMYSGGFVAIEIKDANGNIAATFEDGKLGLITLIDAQTYNPITKTNIAVGDVVPLWSLNENTGVWKEEGAATALMLEGSLHFEVELSHLSYYNFGWLQGTVCENSSPFQFTTNVPLTGPFLIKGYVYRQDDNVLISTIVVWVESAQSTFTTYAPAGVPLRIVWDTQNSTYLSVDPSSQPTLIDDLCSSQPVNVNLIVSQDPSLKEINISVSLVCTSDNSTIIKPSFTAYYIPKDSQVDPIAVEMVQGNATIPGITLGQTYYVWITYDNKEYGTDVEVTQETYNYLNYELPADVCDEVVSALDGL